MKLLILLGLFILQTSNITGYPILIFQSNETFIQAVNTEPELKLNDKHPNYTFITGDNLDYLRKIFNLTLNNTLNNTEDDIRIIHRHLLCKQHHKLKDHSESNIQELHQNTKICNQNNVKNYFIKQRDNLAFIMRNLKLMFGLMLFITLSSFYAVYYYTNNLQMAPQQCFKFIVLINACYITLIFLIAYFD